MIDDGGSIERLVKQIDRSFKMKRYLSTVIALLADNELLSLAKVPKLKADELNPFSSRYKHLSCMVDV